MVLTSGEVTPVADSAGDGNHSVFARYFIQVLRQNDNVMSGEMLSHELSGRMLAQPVQVGQNGQRQRPTYSTLQDANHDTAISFRAGGRAGEGRRAELLDNPTRPGRSRR